MNRRGFLKALGLTAAAAVVPPEILEEPSSKTIFLPPRGGWDLGRGDFTTASMRYKATERLSAVFTDPRGVYGSSGAMTAADFRKMVEPGLNEAFERAYDEHHLSWEKIFDDDGVALTSTAHPEGWEPVTREDLSEKSLERLLIEIRDKLDRDGNPIISLKPTHAIETPFLTNPNAWYLKT